MRGRPIKMSIKVNTFKEVMAGHYAMRGKKIKKKKRFIFVSR